MDPITEPNRLPDGHREPWRCKSCNLLVYNLIDGDPAPGAPIPRYHSREYEEVCAVCHAMANNPRFESSYWKELHAEWKKHQTRVKKWIDDIRSGNDKPGGN